jgi:GTP pyrophosphokinase
MVLTSRLRDAFLLVFELDANHPRKGTQIPYLAHLLSVCAMVLYAGGDEEQACAALLHDTLEDHPDSVTYEWLESRFGKSVADMVTALSDTPQDYRGGKKPEWKVRKEAHLRRLSQEGPKVMLISAADKLDNAQAILADYKKVGEKLWERFNAGREGQIWYYQELVKTYRAAGFSNSVTEELERVVDELNGGRIGLNNQEEK